MTFDEWWQQEPVSDFSGVQASHVEAAWDAAVLAEREACARVCFNLQEPFGRDKSFLEVASLCEDAIRARSKEK